MGHRPGEREAAEAIRACGLEARGKNFATSAELFAACGVSIGHEHGRLASARSRPAARRPGGAEAVGRAVAGRIAEGQRASGAARAPHALAAEEDLRQHEREVRSAAGRVVRCSGGRGRATPPCRRPQRPLRPPRRRFQESRPARPRADSRQDRAGGSRPRSDGGREGGLGRRGEPGRVAAGAERATRLAALDAVRHRPRPQEIRPQGATAGERPDALPSRTWRWPASRPRRFPARWPGRG